MRNKFLSFFKILLISAILSVLVISFISFKVDDTKQNQQVTSVSPQGYKVVVPEIPKSFTFAGEKVPLENWEVYERFEREIIVNTYWHSSTVFFIKKVNRWFPVIEPILKKNNIPDDFKYIALIESGLANVTSPANAVGFWQFLKSTGKQHGLEIGKGIDERYHVEKSTEAACKYLQEAYDKFGSWTLAAASYNMGLRGVSRQLERQKATNYYNLVLNPETSRYVFRAMAAKVILSNPVAYGFHIKKEDLYQPLKYFEVTVNGPVKHWADFADNYGINYKILKMYNPWLRDNTLANKKRKTYKIKIPEQGSIYKIPD